MPVFLNGLDNDEARCLADLTLHDGKYDVVEGTVRILTDDDAVELADWNEEGLLDEGFHR